MPSTHPQNLGTNVFPRLSAFIASIYQLMWSISSEQNNTIVTYCNTLLIDAEGFKIRIQQINRWPTAMLHVYCLWFNIFHQLWFDFGSHKNTYIISSYYRKLNLTYDSDFHCLQSYRYAIKKSQTWQFCDGYLPWNPAATPLIQIRHFFRNLRYYILWAKL